MKKILLTLPILLFSLTITALVANVTNAQYYDCGEGCDPPRPEFCPSWETYPVCKCLDDSPIIVDIKNDGYNLTDSANGVRFDLEGDGILRQWSWTSGNSDEAFLALDRNGDGQITDGKELFGNATEQPVSEEPNGFTALAIFDANGDHWVNSKDEIYKRLLLWTDKNHDGVSQRIEFQTLPEKGVTGISCDFKLSKRSDRYGNRFRFRALAQINGIERWVWDVFFVLGK